MDEMQEFAADQEYAALHPLAVVALVLGVASAFAFVGAVLWAIPLLAIGVALRALMKISASGGGSRGAGLARLGAALAVFCLVGALTRDAVGDALAKKQTFAVAQRWVDLIAANRLEESLEYLTPRTVFNMMPRSAPDAELPTDDEVRANAVEKLRREDVVEKLTTFKGEPVLNAEAWAASPTKDRTTTRFSGDFSIAVQSSPPLGRLKIYFARDEQFEAMGSSWRIDNWQFTALQP